MPAIKIHRRIGDVHNLLGNKPQQIPKISVKCCKKRQVIKSIEKVYEG